MSPRHTRLFTGLAAAALIVTLAGCDASNAGPQQAAPPAPQRPRLTPPAPTTSPWSRPTRIGH